LATQQILTQGFSNFHNQFLRNKGPFKLNGPLLFLLMLFSLRFGPVFRKTGPKRKIYLDGLFLISLLPGLAETRSGD